MSEENNIELSQADIKKKVSDIERKYYKTREMLYNKIQKFYRQSISSEYITENDIRKLLDSCEKLKEEYNELKNEMLANCKNTNTSKFIKFNL